MTPFQEELYRLLQDTRKGVDPFATHDEDAATDIQRIVGFSEKWDCKSQLEKLQQDLKLAQEKAELDKKSGMTKVVKALIKEVVPIIDEIFLLQNFVDRGSPIDKGLQIILANFEKYLANKEGGIIRPQVGEDLDPSKHKAVSAEEVVGHRGNTISQVYRYGYFVLNQIVREAEVKVTCGITPPKKE